MTDVLLIVLAVLVLAFLVWAGKWFVVGMKRGLAGESTDQAPARSDDA